MGCCQANVATKQQRNADELEFTTGVSATARAQADALAKPAAPAAGVVGDPPAAIGLASIGQGAAALDPRPPTEPLRTEAVGGAGGQQRAPIITASPPPEPASGAGANGRQTATAPLRPAAEALEHGHASDHTIPNGAAPENFLLPTRLISSRSQSGALPPSTAGLEWKLDPKELGPGEPPFLDDPTDDPTAMRKSLGFQLATHLKEAEDFGGGPPPGNPPQRDGNAGGIDLLSDTEDVRVNVQDFDVNQRRRGAGYR